MHFDLMGNVMRFFRQQVSEFLGIVSSPFMIGVCRR